MGMTKKAYMDWCEQHDINADPVEADAMWTVEFEAFLDALALKNPLSDGELNKMENHNHE